MSPSTMTSPQSVKRVRFSPDVKDADDVRSPSPALLPKTPRRVPNADAFPPSPPLSDSSLASESECFLHKILLPTSNGSYNFVWDARTNPAAAYIPSRTAPTPLMPYLSTIATHPAQRRITIVSPHLPWAITVENPSGVTIGDILYRISASLQKTVSKEEYEHVRDETMRNDILRAYSRNTQAGTGRPREEGLKRVDWLGKRTVFAGIRKDDRYIASRISDVSARSETYVLEFASPQQ